ncbi:uncharacterized protein LOC116948064 isoform X1 [Petromyzon marinus]|uniref:uncharacterized protein LOC116948064 isoform X1 n=2 Tax=Petromyzon marinus TaxID=7757 RepID=UPI003F710105
MAERRSVHRKETGRAGEMRRRRRPVDEVPSEQTPEPPPAPEDDAHARVPSTGGSAVGNEAGKTRKSKAAVCARRKLRARARCKDPPHQEGTKIKTSSPEDDATQLCADGLRASSTGTTDSPRDNADSVQTQTLPAADVRSEPSSAAAMKALDSRQRKAALPLRKIRCLANNDLRDASGTKPTEQKRGARGTADHQKSVGPRDVVADRQGGSAGASGTAALSPGRTAPAHWRRLVPRKTPAAPVGGLRCAPPRYSGLPIVPTLVPAKVFLASSGFAAPRPPSLPHEHPHSDIAIAAKPDEDGDTALHIAVVQQNVQMVNKIVQLFHMGRISLDVCNHLHQSPLHLAIITGQEALVAVLLSGGASPAALDRHGMNAVHLACSAGQTHVLALLLAQPACRGLLNSHDFSGMTPLHVAVKGSCVSAVSRLLENQVNVDALDWKNGSSALIYAVENDNIEIVELLIKHGANVNQQTYGGNAAVHVASGRGLLEITHLLVRHGANVGLKNTQNDNAYTVTTNQQVIDILKGRTAKPHVTGSDKLSLDSQHGGNAPNKPRDLPNGPATTSVLINRASQTDEPTMSVPSSPRQNSPVQNTRQPVDGSKQGEETSASNTEGSVTGAPSTGEATKSIVQGRIIMKRATAKTTRPCVVVSSSADSSGEVKVKLQSAIRSRVATATFKTTPGTLSQPAQVPSIVTLHPVTPVINVVTTSNSTASKAANASHTLTKTTPSVKEPYISFTKEWLATAKVTPPPTCIATSVITKRLELEPNQSSKDPCTLQLEPRQSSKDPCTLQLEPNQSSKDPCTLQLEPNQSSKDPSTLQLEPRQSSKDPCTLQLEPNQSSKDPCTLQLEPNQSSKDPCTLQLEPKQNSKDPCKSIIPKDVTTQAS